MPILTKCFVCETRQVSMSRDHEIEFTGRIKNAMFRKTKYVCTKCQKVAIFGTLEVNIQ